MRLHSNLTALAATLVAAFLIPSVAFAQSVPCGPRDKILDKLRTQYSEEPVAMGLDASGKVIELLNSPKGSWTILVTGPGGPTCIVAVGENWEFLPSHSDPTRNDT